MFYRNEITDTNVRSNRVHYPWHELEEYTPDGGMWSIPAVGDRERFVEATANLMADPFGGFLAAMRRAVAEWPRSVAQALTTPGLNQRAWLGHAGCYLATGSPEETTRLGWHDLDEYEQRAANAAADQVIAEWNRDNLKARIEVIDEPWLQLTIGGGEDA